MAGDGGWKAMEGRKVAEFGAQLPSRCCCCCCCCGGVAALSLFRLLLAARASTPLDRPRWLPTACHRLPLRVPAASSTRMMCQPSL